jgi:DNA repair exonuclease SbcCD ATPase subunit
MANATKKKAKKKPPTVTELRNKKRDLDYQEEWLNKREKELDNYQERQEESYAGQRKSHESWLEQNKEDRKRVKDETEKIREELDKLKKERDELKTAVEADTSTLEAGKAIKTLMKTLYRTGEELDAEDHKNGRRPRGMWWGPWGPGVW